MSAPEESYMRTWFDLRCECTRCWRRKARTGLALATTGSLATLAQILRVGQ